MMNTGGIHTGSKPFLWGPVKSALIQDAKEQGSDTILRLCYTEEQRVKEMMVVVLTDWGRDDLGKVEDVLERLLPRGESPGKLKRAWRLFRKPSVSNDKPSLNAQAIAIEVAGNLGITETLQSAALHPHASVRAAAVRATYELWKREQERGFEVLDYLSGNMMHGLVPDMAAFESVLGLSLIIFLDHTRDMTVLSRLQIVWRRIIDSVFGITEKSSRVGLATRGLIRKRAISFATNYMFEALKKMPNHVVNYDDLKAFFDRREDPDAYRYVTQLYLRLVAYIDTDGDYPREQMWADLRSALEIRDMLIESAVILIINAHMIRFPNESLPHIKRLLLQAEADRHPTPYIDDLVFSVYNGARRNIEIDELFQVLLQYRVKCQQYYTEHTFTGLQRQRVGVPTMYAGSTFMVAYMRSGSARMDWLDVDLDRALARKDYEYFKSLTEAEFIYIGLEMHQPGAVLDVMGLLVSKLASLEGKDEKSFKAQVEEMLVGVLARMRAVYPDEVDDFIEEQRLSSEFQAQVHTSEPKETVTSLINIGAWDFILDDVVLGSTALRARLLSSLASAADYEDVKPFLDHALREMINVVYGSEILSNPNSPAKARQ